MFAMSCQENKRGKQKKINMQTFGNLQWEHEQEQKKKNQIDYQSKFNECLKLLRDMHDGQKQFEKNGETSAMDQAMESVGDYLKQNKND